MWYLRNFEYEIAKLFLWLIPLDGLRLSSQCSQGFAYDKNYGKPPVESARAIESVGGLNAVTREGTVLCSDGARCYPGLCRTKKSNTAPIGRVSSMWKRDGRGRPLMSIRAQLTMFGGWSKDPCLRIFIRRMLGIQPCSMARFGRMFALGSEDGKTVPTKTSPSSLQRLWRTLSAEKKRRPLRFLTCPVKSTRALFKEIQLWERCKTSVIFGMKWMMNSANVGTAGSINHRRDVYGIVLPTLIMARNHWTEHMDWNHQGQIFHDRSAPDFSHRSHFTTAVPKQKNCTCLHLRSLDRRHEGAKDWNVSDIVFFTSLASPSSPRILAASKYEEIMTATRRPSPPRQLLGQRWW